MEPVTAHQPATGTRRCENCGAQLLGEHCYACGQPTRGLVRHFSSIMGDFFDSVFDFDTRTVRTLLPLLFRPGHLSIEYFQGHRVRYVSPVRLFFFLCIAAFFAVRILVPDEIEFDARAAAAEGTLSGAATVAEAEQIRDRMLAELRQEREAAGDTPVAQAALDTAIGAIESEATRRIEWLRERDAAAARGETPPPWTGPPEPPDGSGGGKRREFRNQFVFNGTPWDPETNPVRMELLPESGNALLNQLIGRSAANLERIRTEPRLLVDAFLEALPQTLFVLLPLFALLLKFVYLFKRRLYMEHLIVALHSHAFLCASLLLLAVLAGLRGLVQDGGALHAGLGWAELALLVWMPLYLLLMQKRVYRQGWPMTLVKYCVLGTCYFFLLLLGALLNLAVSLVAL